MLRSKLFDLLFSAAMAMVPKPEPLPMGAGLLGLAALAAWCYGLVKVTDRDRAQLGEAMLALQNMGTNIDQLNALLAEPEMGETFGTFKARCPGAKLTRGIWPVSDDATWDGSIFVRELDRDRCPLTPHRDPYGLGRSLVAARKVLAEGGRNFRGWHELLSPFGASCAFEPGKDVRDAVCDVLRGEGWTIVVSDDPNGREGAQTIRVSREYTQCEIADALNYSATVGG